MKVLLVFTFLISLSAYAGAAAPDVYQTIYQSVQIDPIIQNLRKMTGYDPIVLNGQTYSLPNRATEETKAGFRKFFVDYFTKLGIPVQELPYNGGTNVEAVLPGKSPDSVVVISHYDSTGNDPLTNPAVDDAASGIAVMMEAAKLLLPYQGRLEHTIRFVVADHEEDNGSGPDTYGDYIVAKMAAENFKVLLAVDYDQSGWISPKNDGKQIDIYVRNQTDTKWATDELLALMKSYSPLEPILTSLPSNTMDDADFLESRGIRGVCPSEKDNAYNPFKDVQGDTFDIINTPYYFALAKIDVTFLAKIVGISP